MYTFINGGRKMKWEKVKKECSFRSRRWGVHRMRKCRMRKKWLSLERESKLNERKRVKKETVDLESESRRKWKENRNRLTEMLHYLLKAKFDESKKKKE